MFLTKKLENSNLWAISLNSLISSQVLKSLDELGDYIRVKFSRHRLSHRPELYDETDFELDS